MRWSSDVPASLPPSVWITWTSLTAFPTEVICCAGRTAVISATSRSKRGQMTSHYDWRWVLWNQACPRNWVSLQRMTHWVIFGTKHFSFLFRSTASIIFPSPSVSALYLSFSLPIFFSPSLFLSPSLLPSNFFIFVVWIQGLLVFNCYSREDEDFIMKGY